MFPFRAAWGNRWRGTAISSIHQAKGAALNPSTDRTEHDLGYLKGQMEALQHQIATLAPAIEASRKESSEGRARIYGELEAIRRDATDSRRDIAELKTQIQGDAPTIAEIKRWKERFIGMQMLLGAGAAIIGGSIVLFWKWVSVKIGLQ